MINFIVNGSEGGPNERIPLAVYLDLLHEGNISLNFILIMGT